MKTVLSCLFLLLSWSHVVLSPLQVASTEGIEVGQWVRFYALAASPARRRLAQAQSTVGSSPGARSDPYKLGEGAAEGLLRFCPSAAPIRLVAAC